ncbi:acyltransferase [Desulfobacterota bacterium M19]
MSKSEYSIWKLFRRLYWDIADPAQRKMYGYWFIWQLPGTFGDMLRSRYMGKIFKYTGENVKILSGARFRSPENLSIGDNSCIGNDNFIQALGGVTIGHDTSLAPSVKIWSVNHNYKNRNKLIGEQGLTKRNVVVGNDVWIASNTFILPGVNLPDGIVVGAGSLVTVKKYQPYSVIAGNPARMIGRRKRDNEVAEILYHVD